MSNFKQENGKDFAAIDVSLPCLMGGGGATVGGVTKSRSHACDLHTNS